MCDSATELPPGAEGKLVVCGSHGGRYAAALLARAGVKGCVLNDAGIGRRRAGVGGLELLSEHGIPAATVGHLSACIGNARDAITNGILSEVNDVAAGLGCMPGMRVRDALPRLALARGSGSPRGDLRVEPEGRHLLRAHPRPIWALDSASLVRPEDAGAVLATGSHGGLVGGDPSMALRVDALAAVFNDAGDAPAGPGTARLAPLDGRGIAAATVSAATAAIGDGESTYFEGVLSAVNEAAARLGASVGMPARQFADSLTDSQDVLFAHERR